MSTTSRATSPAVLLSQWIPKNIRSAHVLRCQSHGQSRAWKTFDFIWRIATWQRATALSVWSTETAIWRRSMRDPEPTEQILTSHSRTGLSQLKRQRLGLCLINSLSLKQNNLSNAWSDYAKTWGRVLAILSISSAHELAIWSILSLDRHKYFQPV